MSFEFNTLLVPTDFSAASKIAFQKAVSLASGDDPLVIILHVIDLSLVEFAAVNELAPRDTALQRVRARAEAELAQFKQDVETQVEIRSIICEGLPFLEILTKAEEFLVDAIVMGKIGARGTLEKLLFGSTAERVLRGSTRPVLVLPAEA
jgi:nucleotide-binding universal stress UspA family protein